MRHYKDYRLDNNPFMFMPVHQLHKEGKPNCTECVGCNTELTPLNVSQAFLGSHFYRPEVWPHHPGWPCAAPSTWLPMPLLVSIDGWAPQPALRQRASGLWWCCCCPPQVGSAQNWVFKATTNKTKSGFAALKVFCLPIPKTGKKPYQ
jgi:hypothetical protein